MLFFSVFFLAAVISANPLTEDLSNLDSGSVKIPTSSTASQDAPNVGIYPSDSASPQDEIAGTNPLESSSVGCASGDSTDVPDDKIQKGGVSACRANTQMNEGSDTEEEGSLPLLVKPNIGLRAKPITKQQQLEIQRARPKPKIPTVRNPCRGSPDPWWRRWTHLTCGGPEVFLPDMPDDQSKFVVNCLKGKSTQNVFSAINISQKKKKKKKFSF